ncbi:MAG: ferritin-like domain-containing protein [Xanthomonadales bacterium]|nr:ferritin-like domain-containing protein [Gammaproteobacteria bacterium]MBT8053898.1 ferritin-like domain-containing protein [Gammaproteobacteria bacterium]NND55989.1 ferritin-like domain-containing protein [Xanthomonadales bacterium]NNK52050.1 ferritin-like domain-containing protein [Xanthomonadales bacterium]
MADGFFESAKACLSLSDPAEKCVAVNDLRQRLEGACLAWDLDFPVEPIGDPGRPATPPLVDASQVPRRRLGSLQGRAALVHAIAHIEFNAINLALDAAYRFRQMPTQYYHDWISVAVDESRHFILLENRLRQMGSRYGELPAHNGLWEMAAKTADSCLVRMALVPRVLEARGLDVTPGMIERLTAVDDHETVAALEVILAEEVRHVAIGTHWFRFCCEQQGCEPLATFLDLLKRYYPASPRGPYNLDARFEAGFSREEMDALAAGFAG